MSRIFRLAQLFEGKYGISVIAEYEPPSTNEVLDKVKKSIIECYNIFFNEKEQYGSSLKKAPKVISRDALFELKRKGEPFTELIFRKMEDLIIDLDESSPADIVKLLHSILLDMKDAINTKGVETFLEQFGIDRPAKEWRRQLYRGFKDVINRSSRRLDTAKRITLSLIPDEEKLALLQELSEEGHSGKITPGPTPTSEGLIRRFLISPAATKHGLTKENWDLMNTDPTFRLPLIKLLNSWERNNEVFKPELAEQLGKIIEIFKQRKENNISELEQNEPVASAGFFNFEDE